MYVDLLLTSCLTTGEGENLVLFGIIIGAFIAVLYYLVRSKNRSYKEGTTGAIVFASAQLDLENPSNLGLPPSCPDTNFAI